MKIIVYTNPPTIEFLYKREINYVAKIIFENDYHTIPITIKVSTSAKEIKINMDTKHPNIFTAIKLINTSAVIVPKNIYTILHLDQLPTYTDCMDDFEVTNETPLLLFTSIFPTFLNI